MKKTGTLLALLAAVSLTGCGPWYQNYHNGLVANQNVFHRQQLILDEQNQVTINDYKSKQRQQLIDQEKADAKMTVIKAQAQADATLVQAEADAKAMHLKASAITPLLVQEELVNSLNDKTVIYAPSNVLPLMNLNAAAAWFNNK